jgi:hypothetical protein
MPCSGENVNGRLSDAVLRLGNEESGGGWAELENYEAGFDMIKL